ncbi:GtrA family protein [Clostridium sp. BJN0001]|uniref:GtrA family protein n=1 Tax=Clostridium sp. BJN0001 TaxID=2930219 RepID=UPI001FCFAA16|nr:GtrA family protein [Clostridium sp. BJN0001]
MNIKNKFNNLIIQFIKFGLVGITNTVITLGIYYILIYFGINYMISYTSGFILGIVNSYYWNNKYVFEKIKSNNFKSFIKNFISYLATFILSIILLMVMVRYMSISQEIAPILNLIITMVLNFLLNKFWIFN